MKLLKNCQAIDSDGYRVGLIDLAMDVNSDGVLINPWHYDQPIVLVEDNFTSSNLANTAEVKMQEAAWSILVDSGKLHAKITELNATMLNT